jgi:hypothetical protein
MRDDELKLALGPAGIAGVVAMVLGLARRSPVLFAAGFAALAADAAFPRLHGLAAARARRDATPG